MNDKQVRTTYITPAFRLSYPALFEAKAVMGDESKKRFSATMLFPKASITAALKSQKHAASTWMPTDNCQAFYQEIVKVARANFGPDVSLPTLKLTKFRDGDKPKEGTGKTDENEKGYIVVRSSTETRPDCLRQDKTRISDPNELYAGCWVRAVLTIAPFLKPQRGVTVYLAGIQKLADDTTFSSRPRAEDEFDAVASEGGAGVVAEGAPSAATKDPWEV